MSTLLPESGRPRRNRPSKRLLLGGAAVVTLALVSVVAYFLWTGNRERAAALLDVKSGKFTQAEPALRAAYARNSADREVTEALARGYAKADDAQAAEFLSRWADARPADAEPLKLRFEHFRKRKDPRAYADARRLSDRSPDDFALRRTAMNQAFSYGYFAESEELCRACLREKPGDTALLVMLAETRRAQGDGPGAAAILDDVLAANPGQAVGMQARALLYEEAGEFAKAVPLLREAYRLDEKQRRSIGYLLSVALDRAGQPEEARRVLAEVRLLQEVQIIGETLQGQPDNLELRVRLAQAYLDAGRAKEGADQLQAILGRNPAFAPAHAALAAYYEQQGQADLAAAHRRRAGLPPATPKAP